LGFGRFGDPDVQSAVDRGNEAETETLHQRRSTQRATALTPGLISLLFLILPAVVTAQPAKPHFTLGESFNSLALRERNLALAVFNAVRDSSSSAHKNGDLLGMTGQAAERDGACE
jgi:hypothetical protein